VEADAGEEAAEGIRDARVAAEADAADVEEEVAEDVVLKERSGAEAQRR